MTFGRMQHQFGNLFPLCQTYWRFVQHLNNGSINQNQFAVLSWRLYEKLKIEWLEYKRDLQELDWIVSALDDNSSMLDPNNFVNSPNAYDDHAKTCFFLEQNDF